MPSCTEPRFIRRKRVKEERGGGKKEANASSLIGTPAGIYSIALVSYPLSILYLAVHAVFSNISPSVLPPKFDHLLLNIHLF